MDEQLQNSQSSSSFFMNCSFASEISIDDDNPNIINTTSIASLLHEWELDPYIESFTRKGISSSDLLTVADNIFKDLISSADDRKKFFDQRQKWRDQHISALAIGENSQEIVEVEKSACNIFVKKNVLLSKLTPDRINGILETHGSLKILKANYNCEVGITENQSNKVVDHIVETLLATFGSDLWEDSHYKAIANCIIKIFPSETLEIYYIPRILKKESKDNKHRQTRGKVSDKFRNLKYMHEKLSRKTTKRNKSTTNESNSSKLPRLEDQSHCVKNSITWLEQNENPLNDLLCHWKVTAEYRYNFIRSKKDLSIDEILMTWPALKNSEHAPALIQQDFELIQKKIVLNDSSNDNVENREHLIHQWEKFIKIIREKSNCASSDYSQKLMRLIDENRTSNDSRVIAQLLLLPYLVAPRGKLSCANKSKKKKNNTISVRESLVVFIHDLKDIMKKQEALKNASDKQPIQPYIIAVGKDIETITKILVCVNEVQFQTSSALEAIDICFKLFFVLDAKYPDSSKHIWLLIQMGLYKLKTKGDSEPSITRMSALDFRLVDISYDTFRREFNNKTIDHTTSQSQKNDEQNT
ncbi:hypothetical protein PV328_007659 [Microctonus aethiopoides]|uniref:Uncharacterized protein n=1 Tax=Microctonus aethiopoides TaxID=144406 RepID=A0AA39F0S3_9HYME|nr:hypothetical protein PV328_007659 [Microctonus aethiopoides]